jgi:uncharacterized Zn finger protein
MNTYYICKTCRIHTNQKKSSLGNGRYTVTCLECGTVSPTFDIDGKEILEEQLKEEKQEWR